MWSSIRYAEYFITNHTSININPRLRLQRKTHCYYQTKKILIQLFYKRHLYTTPEDANCQHLKVITKVYVYRVGVVPKLFCL